MGSVWLMKPNTHTHNSLPCKKKNEAASSTEKISFEKRGTSQETEINSRREGSLVRNLLRWKEIVFEEVIQLNTKRRGRRRMVPHFLPRRTGRKRLLSKISPRGDLLVGVVDELYTFLCWLFRSNCFDGSPWGRFKEKSSIPLFPHL